MADGAPCGPAPIRRTTGAWRPGDQADRWPGAHRAPTERGVQRHDRDGRATAERSGRSGPTARVTEGGTMDDHDDGAERMASSARTASRSTGRPGRPGGASSAGARDHRRGSGSSRRCRRPWANRRPTTSSTPSTLSSRSGSASSASWPRWRCSSPGVATWRGAYWLAVVMVGIFGTMAADVLHVGFHVPYVASALLYAVVLAAVFVTWQRTEGTLSVHTIDTARRELFYWAAVVDLRAGHRGRRPDGHHPQPRLPRFGHPVRGRDRRRRGRPRPVRAQPDRGVLGLRTWSPGRSAPPSPTGSPRRRRPAAWGSAAGR